MKRDRLGLAPGRPLFLEMIGLSLYTGNKAPAPLSRAGAKAQLKWINPKRHDPGHQESCPHPPRHLDWEGLRRLRGAWE